MLMRILIEKMVDHTFIIPDVKEDPVFPPLNDTFLKAPEGGLQLLDDNWFTKDKTRNSLEVLSNDALYGKNSLAERLISPRESLGILNISAIDLGNESEAIWGFKSPVVKKPLNGPIPHILIANMEESANSPMSLTVEQNLVFLPTNVKKISNSSSTFSDPSVEAVSPLLNTESLQELSFVYSHKMGSDPSEISPIAVSDPLNNAFRMSENIRSVSCKAANRPQNFTEDLIKIKHRIRSLPGVLQADTFSSDAINVVKNVRANSSIAEGGLNLDDSIFIHAESGQNQNEISFNDERYLLDSTPQPEWAAEFDSSTSSSEVKPQIYGNDDIAKMIDRMFGIQSTNLQDKVKLISGTKCENVSLIDVCFSQQASKVNCQSSISEDCNDNGNHLNPATDQKNLSVIIKNLSDIINENDNLSNSQKDDGHHILNQLFNLLSNRGDQKLQDSGHSSAAEEKFGESDDRTESSESKQSCSKRKSPYMNFQKELVNSKPVRNTDCKKTISNCASTSSSNNVVSGLLSRPKTLSKFQPLRATVPIENMVRDHVVPILMTSNKNVQVTPDRKRSFNTPTQEPKLRKPMAASTPTGKETKLTSVFVKTSSSSLSAGRTSTMSSKTAPGNKKSNASLPNSEVPMFVRNNSLCENQLKYLKDRRDSGIPAFKRKSSIGEGSKVKNVLSRVRENLLNSPHFRGPSEELTNTGTKALQKTKAEKENMSPA